MTTDLRTPADIIAAAAGFLGFAPTNSIVAYMLRADTGQNLTVRCAIRFDVTITTAQAANLPATCNLRPTDNHGAILLAVCDEQRYPHALAVLDALRDALTDAGIPVRHRIMTRDVTAEGQWYDPDTGQHGPTYPYTDSLITAQRVLSGGRVSRGRSDIEAEFAPLPPAPPVALGDHGELVLSTAEEIADALNGHPINRSLPTRAGHIITADVSMRDAMIWAAIEHTQAATDLWTHIARRLRGQPRAEALTIAATAYCLLGDTVRAGIAVDTALEEAQAAHAPAPRLAVLLLAALRAGLPPDEIQRVILNSAPRSHSD
ncbi:DUF4192 family protein (plasmid) [Mycobacterium sp. Aquia_216]|uniref:DUF4192 family protein n=1 Tax=Mycobacterium sp. Aquia_216 TaxID=2991729 RepID=UPI00227B45AD|nr:DUF4192 family protein [Mycobacterium sp. Aquia_216]WAJ47983.1 DUF4192 family protein [Mycobacterium sp. Aquia_216]